MPVPAATGNFSNHLAPGIRGIVGTNLRSSETYYSRFLNTSTSDRNYEDRLAAAGLPIAARKAQGQGIPTYPVLEGNTQRISFDVWGIGFSVTQEMWEDDLYKGQGSAIRDGANNIADSLRERVEIQAHLPFGAGGYDGSTYTVLPDNSGLFATSHSPVAGAHGVAQANRPSTDVELSVTSYRAGVVQFKKWTNDQGLRIPGYTKPVRLGCSVDLEYTALEVVRNPTRVDAGDGVKNVHRMVEVVGDPYITDTNNWFLQGAKHFMEFVWRWRPRLDNYDDRDRRIAKFVGYERFTVNALHWLGMYGTAPS